MKKALPVLVLAFLTLSATAVHSPQHESLQVQGEISQEDKNFYPEQQTVEYPSIKSGEETVKYSNVSYKEYVSWQVKDKGLQKIRSRLKSDLSLNGIRTGSTAERIEITYIENESIERDYSYQKLKEVVPSQIKGSYKINGETINTTIDVKLEKKEDSLAQDDLAYSVARDSESFGSSSGKNYNANFNILNTTQGEHTGGQIKNVSVKGNAMSFTGYLEMSQPCNKINRTYEQKESKLILKVDSYSTGEPCVDVIAFKKYSFNLESEEPIRLEVRHNGQKIRTLNGLQARNLKKSDDRSEESGIVAEIVNFFQNLF